MPGDLLPLRQDVRHPRSTAGWRDRPPWQAAAHAGRATNQEQIRNPTDTDIKRALQRQSETRNEECCSKLTDTPGHNIRVTRWMTPNNTAALCDRDANEWICVHRASPTSEALHLACAPCTWLYAVHNHVVPQRAEQCLFFRPSRKRNKSGPEPLSIHTGGINPILRTPPRRTGHATQCWMQSPPTA